MGEAATYHRQVFPGQPDQVCQVRRLVGQHARTTPVAADVTLIASELASNAVRHSRSRDAEFTVACEVTAQYVWLAVEDRGNPWRPPEPDGCHYGLAIVAALATRWGVEATAGGRVAWARVEFGAAGDLMTRREVAYRFRVTSAAVATWARRHVLAEVRDEQGRPRYRRADVEELYASGFRGRRHRG
jgi:serine/threonine-protein kinase RsbW